MTKDNLESPWIMFEAGALSKNIDKSKVCPLLFGIEPSDIQGPLVQFQAAKFSKKEMKKVVKMVNSELGDLGLSSEVLDNVFEMWWAKLDEKIQAELSVPTKKKEDIRSERDILEEVLKLAREISINKSKAKDKESSISPGLIHELYYTAQRLGIMAAQTGSPEVFEYTERMFMLLEDLVYGIDMPKNMIMDLRHNTRYMIEESRMIMDKYRQKIEKTTATKKVVKK